MKHITLYLSIFILAISVLGCNSTDKDNTHTKELKEKKKVRTFNISKYSSVNTAYGKLMDLHDDVMKINTRLNKAISDMKTAKKKLDLKSDEEILEISKIITELELAEEAMLDWMHNIRNDLSDLEEKQGLTYISEQTKEMLNVKLLMKNSITEANRYKTK